MMLTTSVPRESVGPCQVGTYMTRVAIKVSSSGADEDSVLAFAASRTLPSLWQYMRVPSWVLHASPPSSLPTPHTHTTTHLSPVCTFKTPRVKRREKR